MCDGPICDCAAERASQDSNMVVKAQQLIVPTRVGISQKNNLFLSS
jgi:hypothetical protein